MTCSTVCQANVVSSVQSHSLIEAVFLPKGDLSLFDMQRFVTSWWSSSVVWSSSLSPGCSCSKTCRNSSAEKPSFSWSTPEAWTNWLSVTLPRSAPPESTSTSSESLHCLTAKMRNICIECVLLIKLQSNISYWLLVITQWWIKWDKNKRGGIVNKKERGDEADELTWNEARAKEACGLRLLCVSQLGQTLYPPPSCLFSVSVISFPFSKNFMPDCYPSTFLSGRRK